MQVDEETRWYASAYAEAQLKTYHCDKVRKVPLSALDPSMLLGFLCKDQADFEDFCERVAKVSVELSPVSRSSNVTADDIASAKDIFGARRTTDVGR
jgi:cysteine protease ATG4